MHKASTFEQEKNNELTLNQCIKVIDDLEKTAKTLSATPQVFLSGGDPILRDDFWGLLTYLAIKGIRTSILGNPYHINNRSAQKLKNLNLKGYQISIDGLRKTHDEIRKKGSFDSSIKAINILKKKGIKTKVMFTMSKKNYKELIDVIRLIQKLGVDVFSFERITPLGSAKEKDMLSQRELKSILIKAYKEFDKFKKKGSKTKFVKRIHLYSLVQLEKKEIEPFNGKKIYSGCTAGVTGVSIIADGTVYPCRRLPIAIGKVPEQSLKDIFLKSPLLNKLRDINNYQKCKNCSIAPICRGCPAIAYAITGDCFGKDPQCWKKI